MYLRVNNIQVTRYLDTRWSLLMVLFSYDRIRNSAVCVMYYKSAQLMHLFCIWLYFKSLVGFKYVPRCPTEQRGHVSKPITGTL